MAASGPARAPTESARVFLPADKDPTAGGLLLEVALQAQNVITLDQHPRVDGAVRLMAGRAALTHRLVLEHKRTSLGDVTLAARLLLRGKACPTADDRLSLVRIMTIGATDFSSTRDGPGMRPVQHWMSVRQTKLGALIQVALETGLRRFARVDNCAMRAA